MRGAFEMGAQTDRAGRGGCARREFHAGARRLRPAFPAEGALDYSGPKKGHCALFDDGSIGGNHRACTIIRW